MLTKQELRKEIRRRFKATSEEERKEWSRKMCDALLADDIISSAKCILAFYPLDDEVDIRPVMHTYIAMGKTVLLPEVISSEEMQLHVFNSETNLETGVLGTQHPAGNIFTHYDSIDAVLVPGMAFTKQGMRLGRGKGYYDRFLPKLNNAYSRAVYFPYQIVGNNEMPADEHDIKIRKV